MTRGYYQLSSLPALETAVRRLSARPRTTVSRSLGYANRHLLRVDHTDNDNPEPILRDVDAMVRVLRTEPRPAVRWVDVEDLAR